MGTYYRYVNFTRREFVSLSDLRDGGDKENAVLYCGPALLWLLVYPHTCGDGYRGRWRSWMTDHPAHDVRVISDATHDFYEMEEGGTSRMPDRFLNITPGLLQSLRAAYPGITSDYEPHPHDVQLSTHANANGLYTPLEAVSANCKCGWKVGPIHGEHRDETLLQIVSDHVNQKRNESPPREPRPFVYRAELSSDDVCDLVEALGIVGSAGAPLSGDWARMCALRDRLANIPGTQG